MAACAVHGGRHICWQDHCTVGKLEPLAQAVAGMGLVVCSQSKLVEVCVMQREDNDCDRHLQRCGAPITVTILALQLGVEA